MTDRHAWRSGPSGGGLTRLCGLPQVEAPIVLTRYRVTLEALERLDLPAYLGSTLRGAFGHAFRRLACPVRGEEPCPIPETCPYHLIFETRLPPDAPALRSYDEIPRPFVIAAPPAAARDYPAGSEVGFDLTLIGRARQFFPYFVVAFREVESLGRGRRPVRLRRIDVTHPLTGEARNVYSADHNLVRAHDLSLSLEECVSASPPGRVQVQFLTLTEPFQERDLETGLIRHLEKFLLELGQGFAFVGRQHRLSVGDEDFYIDLLFYHLRLRAFVVIELKKAAVVAPMNRGLKGPVPVRKRKGLAVYA